jgi:hypothetical protein
MCNIYMCVNVVYGRVLVGMCAYGYMGTYVQTCILVSV